jgi:hypothetical protein
VQQNIEERWECGKWIMLVLILSVVGNIFNVTKSNDQELHLGSDSPSQEA